jgi:hypothetical protein
MRTLMSGLCALVVLAGSTACSDHHEPNADLQGHWELIDAQIPGTPFQGSGVPNATLVIRRDGTGQAITGCVVATVKVEAHGRDVTLHVPESGFMFGCVGGEELEGIYEDALRSVDSAAVTTDALVLNGPSIELRFERT